MTDEGLDLGDNHVLHYFAWAPDRALNPQYEDVPDCDRAGAIVKHNRPDGTPCVGSAVTFDTAPEPCIRDPRAVWHLESWEPLTLSPSLLCRACGDHGFIRQGHWERA